MNRSVSKCEWDAAAGNSDCESLAEACSTGVSRSEDFLSQENQYLHTMSHDAKEVGSEEIGLLQ